MGLFFNDNGPPNLFKNNGIKETNQAYFKNDPVSDLLKEQQKLRETVEKEGNFSQMIMDHILAQYDTSEEIKNRLKKNDSDYQALLLLLNNQIEHQKELSKKISLQEGFQNKVLNRLDKHEALTEKLSLQFTNLRSILFERTNFLAEKIEECYKLTSSFIHKALSDSHQPVSFYLRNRKKEDKNK